MLILLKNFLVNIHDLTEDINKVEIGEEEDNE